MQRRLYTSNDFTGHYPVGTAAVVWATDEEEAKAILNEACQEAGLKGFDGTIQEFDGRVRILRDGDY